MYTFVATFLIIVHALFTFNHLDSLILTQERFKFG